MGDKDEFYIGYVDSVGKNTRKSIKVFVLGALGTLILGAFLFGFFQRPASNSSFDFDTATKVSGVYHEMPYPMLRVALEKDVHKNILLLGFGKFGANPYLKDICKKEGTLEGMQLTIEGNLIYYNGKTLLQIDDSQKISLTNSSKKNPISKEALGKKILEGEIVDPKCYFGVMKPGYGKIHRSCASLCISGGIPPVLVTSDENAISDYFLLTDLKGNPLHKDILPYIGQPSQLQGEVEKLEDWHVLRIDVTEIEKLNKESSIY
ncbi:hypothetical protein [Flagellimonas allohymeniacidonis]|uniref:Uncharacterized protein n=1 Tax=Flagellimonas allohymeniacidonis TaxID=2517819 RepID=A0A4Q8QCL9_9FLAO|nr:hypothetical protein [Allomuricauda hymeniacidonis]TAI46848.1 hypothetical protein EW142_09095 [Allomuricauda hymeniacidonis]